MSATSARPKSETIRLSSRQPKVRLAFLESWRPHRPWRRYLWSLLLVAGATFVSAVVSSSVDPTNLVMIFLTSVVIAAVYLGRGPSVMTAILGVLAFDFFFVPPHLTLVVADPQYLLTFLGLLTVGLVISTLTGRVRAQADAARLRELGAIELYQFGRDLTASFSLDDILHSVVTHVRQTFDCEVVLLLPEGGILQPQVATPNLALEKDEFALATFSFQHGESVGRGTRTHSATTLLCMPLKTLRGTVGVLGIKSGSAQAPWKQEQYRLLESFADQAALAIERAEFAEQARQAEVLQKTEKLQSALLNSISHDLRTPLVSITGTLSSLQEDSAQLDGAARTMVDTAYGEAQRLNQLVGDLLDMSRIEAGALRVHQEPCDVQDLIGSALDRLKDRLKDRNVIVDIPRDLPMVPLDFVLMVQVLVNLLDNAHKYSPPGTPIEIIVIPRPATIEIRVADRGIGVPAADLVHVFDKFFRVQRAEGATGTGLGLAICKGIVEVLHGSIRAERREQSGTVIVVELPLSPSGMVPDIQSPHAVEVSV